MKNLLFRPDTRCLGDVGKALAAAARAFPVPAAHRKELPFAVRDLSRLLTAERGGLSSRSYWSAPRFLAAYLRYFLPWNLYRLSWLLPGLDLPLRAGGHIIDIGSGPLTLPIALWCARPDLRALPLSFTCCDTALRPMEIGRAILRDLAGEDSPWRISLVRAGLDTILGAGGKGGGRRNPLPGASQSTGREGREGAATALPQKRGASEEAAVAAKADCIFAGNVLNELSASRHQPLEERLEQLMRQALRRLAPGGRMLLVEPGTRLGGKTVAMCRKGALSAGFLPLAPCPHSGPCPMLEQHLHYAASPPFSGWCHFIHPAVGAPRELLELGKQARLEKSSLAMSCLLLASPGAPEGTAPRFPESMEHAPLATAAFLADDMDDLEALYEEVLAEDAARQRRPVEGKRGGQTAERAVPPARAEAQTRSGRPATAGGGPHGTEFPVMPDSLQPGAYGAVRVISDMIRLPEEEEPGRYACCAKGLALLLDAARIPSGGAVLLPWPEREERDPKTGALVLRHQLKKPAASSPDVGHAPSRGTAASRGEIPAAAYPKGKARTEVSRAAGKRATASRDSGPAAQGESSEIPRKGKGAHAVRKSQAPRTRRAVGAKKGKPGT